MSKKYQLAFRVTEDEKKNIEKKAKEKGMSVSKLMIMLWYRSGEQL